MSVMVEIYVKDKIKVDNCYQCPNYVKEMGGGSCKILPSHNYQDIVNARGIDRKCPFKTNG